jgi:hypothetical protein
MSPIVQSEGGNRHEHHVLLVILGIREKFRGEALEDDLVQKKIPFARVDGFDAKQSRVPESWKNKKRSHFLIGRDLTDTEIACTWGHMRALQTGHVEGTEWTLVIEDNVSPINIVEIYESLTSLKIGDPSLISFFSAKKFNFPTRKNRFANSIVLRKTVSIPTGSKCYAVNRSGLMQLAKLFDCYGFQGYLADFPLFYTNEISIMLCDNYPIQLNSSESLIGERSKLAKTSKFKRIYSAEWGFIFSWLRSENISVITFLRFTWFRTLAHALNRNIFFKD